jgi:oxygen-independent coproporphyrinogen III oxidase
MPGVYISYPFCGQKCTYCNFASGVLPRELEASYLAALEREIARQRWQWTPETVYFGGGSPNRMAPGALANTLSRIPSRKSWREATMEAAPGELSAELIAAWARAGINRVSLGVQSFVEAELRRTGRKHTAEIVARDVAMLAEAGITNVNLDLIAGLPGQTPASWQASLDWIARLAPPHVSVYMLEVDEDSRLGLEILGQGPRYGAPDVPDEDLTADLYETAVERLARIGIARYEISNFARPGAESVHNLKYWRLEPYIGFGADAHSFDGGLRWQNVETAANYAAVADPRANTTKASADERFFVGLRLAEGIEPTGVELMRHSAAIETFIDDGLLEFEGPRLRLTSRGMLLSNEVFAEFLDAREPDESAPSQAGPAAGTVL